MRTPINKLIVKLEKKLYDSRTFESGQTIYFDPTWHPEEYAMLKAQVVSVPPGVIDRPDYAGYSIPIKPGDEILIRYDVVFAYDDQPDRDTPRYKNLIFQYDEQEQKYEELWLCDILQVFAVIENGTYKMINGHVMLSIMKQLDQSKSNIIITPDSYRDLDMRHMAAVRAGGNPLGLMPGDTVYINPQMVMQYQLNLERFYIIKEQYILAKAT
jgi:co-chaperonin GroES (HSP10)